MTTIKDHLRHAAVQLIHALLVAALIGFPFALYFWEMTP
jgi:hypothetical protein